MPCNWLLIITSAQTIKFDLLTRSLVWRLRFVCCHKPCQATAATTTIVVGWTCPLCPLTFHPLPILKCLMLIEKVFGNVPKLIKSVWSLKMEKFRPNGDVDGANLMTRCSRLPMWKSLSPCSESSEMQYPCMQRQNLWIVHDLVQRSVPTDNIG